MPVAVAPQLTNAGVWKAPPILVSGATAYRHGEFLYQDFLYDDHGAQDPPGDSFDPESQGDGFSRPAGTYTYPTAAAYANNAADLVEFRVKPLDDSTAFRVTLNTLLDPSLVAFSVAIGGSPGTEFNFPDGANVKAPAAYFLTVHPAPGGGMAGDLVDAATQLPIAGVAPTVNVDKTRRQIEVDVSHTQWDPGTSVVRLAAGVGLWDGANARYLLPTVTQRNNTGQPGGSGNVAAPAAFFNVAFRSGIPGKVNYEPVTNVADLAGSAQHPAWWRESHQATALAAGDISDFHADVDFAKLAADVDDDSGVPTTGPIDRILQSHTESAQGVNYSQCQMVDEAMCPGNFTGQLQPYALYVPAVSPPPSGYGLTVLLHAFQDNYNEFEGARYQSQLGDRGTGSLVLSTEGRGPETTYMGPAGVEVFEAWADVAAHYAVDPDLTAIAGYSAGGIGTFTLAEQFPDLFARMQTTVGADKQPLYLSTLRNVPVLMWNMLTDELANPALYGATAARLQQLGYRYELDVFTPGEHTTLAFNDQFAPVAAWLDSATVDRNPAHVDYTVDTSQDRPDLHFQADHAYWLSKLVTRSNATTSVNPVTGPTSPGSVDAFSHGFGVGEAPVVGPSLGAGTLTGGDLPVPLAFVSTTQSWGPVPAAPVADVLDLTFTNISKATVDVARAHLDCNVALNVTTDGPVTVTLDGCGRTVSFG